MDTNNDQKRCYVALNISDSMFLEATDTFYIERLTSSFEEVIKTKKEMPTVSLITNQAVLDRLSSAHGITLPLRNNKENATSKVFLLEGDVLFVVMPIERVPLRLLRDSVLPESIRLKVVKYRYVRRDK